MLSGVTVQKRIHTVSVLYSKIVWLLLLEMMDVYIKYHISIPHIFCIIMLPYLLRDISMETL
jgi:hypothetical protein